MTSHASRTGRSSVRSAWSRDSRVPTDTVPMTSLPSGSKTGTFTRQDSPSVPVWVPT